MILAIDQAITNTGWVLVDKDGVLIKTGLIETKPEKKKRNIGAMDDSCRRTKHIYTELYKIVKGNPIGLIVCEEYAGYSQSKASADALATSRTIVTCLSLAENLPLFYISAMDAKQAMTGNRSASKDEMVKAFESLFMVEATKYAKGKREHIADAYGIYLASLNLEQVKWFRR